MTQKKVAVHKDKDTKLPSISSKKVALKAVKALKSKELPPQEEAKAKNIGDVLRVVRESKGESLKNIADALRIGENYLRAIEAMDQNALPEKVYALGFIRSYAHYLGVDPQKSVAQFKSELFLKDSSLGSKNFSVPQPVDSNSLPNNKILWVTFFALVGVLGTGYFYWGQSSVSFDKEISSFLTPASDTLADENTLVAPDFSQGLLQDPLVKEAPGTLTGFPK